MLDRFDRYDVSPLRFWVHHILPLVYDDSLSYYEVLAKMSYKMNEVIEGLNKNNEQVENLTEYTQEQIKNLTQSFNNFQQSMLTRQEEFETKVLDSQQSFETQLMGEIAEWEANTEEKFNDKIEQDISTAEQKLKSDIDQWKTQTADELDEKIEQEKHRAEAAEQANATAISAEQSRAEAEEQSLDSKITAETTRATKAEETNATAISTETARAETAEQKNATAISEETTRAMTAEQANATAISDLEGRIPASVTVVQTIGDSTTDVMSQDAVTKFLKLAVQEAGNAGLDKAFKTTGLQGLDYEADLNDYTSYGCYYSVGRSQINIPPASDYNGYVLYVYEYGQDEHEYAVQIWQGGGSGETFVRTYNKYNAQWDEKGWVKLGDSADLTELRQELTNVKQTADNALPITGGNVTGTLTVNDGDTVFVNAKNNLSGEVDINTLKPGIYGIASTVAKIPVRMSGMMYVVQYAKESFPQQIYVTNGNYNDGKTRVFYRGSLNTKPTDDNMWTPWNEVLMQHEADGKYLPVTGGNVTGDLTIQDKAILINNATYFVDNLNNLITPGISGVSSSATNIPVSQSGIVIVGTTSKGKYPVQIYLTNTSPMKLYVRRATNPDNTMWTSWNEFATTDDLKSIPASNVTGLANVAKTGSYDDLTSKPDLASEYFSLKNFTPISESADLNTYTTPGNYACTTASAAPHIQHAPGVANAFVMFVYLSQGTGVGVMQEIHYQSGEIYTRANSSIGWSNWVKLATENDLQSVPRPTYFLSTAPFTDTGGVGTTYIIAVSNLNPNTPKPSSGDTVVFYTNLATYVGFVTTVQKDSVDVKVSYKIGQQGNSFSLDRFEEVISNADLNLMFDAGSYACFYPNGTRVSNAPSGITEYGFTMWIYHVKTVTQAEYVTGQFLISHEEGAYIRQYRDGRWGKWKQL